MSFAISLFIDNFKGDMMIKSKLLISIFLLLTTANVRAEGCNSRSNCLRKVPQYDQGELSLAEYIAVIYDIEAEDQGWCGAVTGAMVLKALTFGKPSYFDFGSEIMNDFADYKMQGNQKYHQVYHAGYAFKTDFVNGGTSIENAYKVYKYIYDRYPKNQSRKFIKYKKSLESVAEYLKKLKADILNFRPVYHMSISAYKKSRYSHGHAVVLRGVDETGFRITDPWGREYNVGFRLGTKRIVQNFTKTITLNGQTQKRKYKQTNKLKVAKVILSDMLDSDGGYVGEYKDDLSLLVRSLAGIALN